MDSSDDNVNECGISEAEKAQQAVWKTGYVEGKTEGRQQGLQAGFDAGYDSALQLTMKLGMFAGMIDALMAKDKSLKSFLASLREAVNQKMEECSAALKSIDESTVHVDEKKFQQELDDGIKQSIGQLEERFLSTFPYGEEQAQRILDSLK